MEINFKKLNPVGFYLLRFLQDLTIRFIILFGGSSSGKSYSVAQIILIFTLWEGSNTLVMRKVGASIRDSIYQDFKTAADQLGITNLFRFSDGVKTITCLSNGARIVFKGLDDSEKIKGLSSFKRVVLDSRAYKQATGEKLSEYILVRRLERAKQLLQQPEKKISEIGYLIGLDSAAHFSRVFKKYTGLSPQEYREASAHL